MRQVGECGGHSPPPAGPGSRPQLAPFCRRRCCRHPPQPTISAPRTLPPSVNSQNLNGRSTTTDDTPTPGERKPRVATQNQARLASRVQAIHPRIRPASLLSDRATSRPSSTPTHHAGRRQHTTFVNYSDGSVVGARSGPDLAKVKTTRHLKHRGWIAAQPRNSNAPIHRPVTTQCRYPALRSPN